MRKIIYILTTLSFVVFGCVSPQSYESYTMKAFVQAGTANYMFSLLGRNDVLLRVGLSDNFVAELERCFDIQQVDGLVFKVAVPPLLRIYNMNSEWVSEPLNDFEAFQPLLYAPAHYGSVQAGINSGVLGIKDLLGMFLDQYSFVRHSNAYFQDVHLGNLLYLSDTNQTIVEFAWADFGQSVQPLAASTLLSDEYKIQIDRTFCSLVKAGERARSPVFLQFLDKVATKHKDLASLNADVYFNHMRISLQHYVTLYLPHIELIALAGRMAPTVTFAVVELTKNAKALKNELDDLKEVVKRMEEREKRRFGEEL